MLLKRMIHGRKDIALDTEAADTDGDGELTIRDAMILMRYDNGWKRYDALFQ